MATNDVRYTLNGGFFNARWTGEGEAPAVTYDRTYDSEDMMQPYINVVTEGIFAYQTNESGGEPQLQVGFPCTVKTNENTVSIQAGRGILNHHWFELDHTENISIATNSSLTNRIDSLIIQCNMNMDERAMYLIYRQGTASAPALETNNTTIFEFRLWNISVPNMNTGTEQITLEDKRGTIECPYITGLLQQLTLDERLNKFDDDVTEKINSYDQQLLDKIDEFENQGQSAISTFNTNSSEAIENFETESGQKITAFETTSNEKISTFETNSEDAINTFNTTSQQKLGQFDSQFQQKLSGYDSQFSAKLQSYDNSMASIWAEWNAIKEEIEETGGGGITTSISVATQHVEYTSGTITVADYASLTDTIFVFINGLYANTTDDYTFADGVITFKNTINSGAVIDIWKFRVQTIASGADDPVQSFALEVKDSGNDNVTIDGDGTYHITSGASYFAKAPLYNGTYRWEQYSGSEWTTIENQSSTTIPFSAGQYSQLRCVITYNGVEYVSTAITLTVS